MDSWQRFDETLPDKVRIFISSYLKKKNLHIFNMEDITDTDIYMQIKYLKKLN